MFKKQFLVLVAAVCLLPACGSKKNAEKDSREQQAPFSAVGEWQVVEKTCGGETIAGLYSEKVTVANNGAVVAFRFNTEDDATHFCGRVDAYNLVVQSSRSVKENGNQTVIIQEGVLTPFGRRTACFRKVNGERAEETPYSDRSSDLAGEDAAARITQTEKDRLELTTERSPLCRNDVSTLKLERVQAN